MGYELHPENNVPDTISPPYSASDEDMVYPAFKSFDRRIFSYLAQLIAAVYGPKRALLKDDLMSGSLSAVCRDLAELQDLPFADALSTDWHAIEQSYLELFRANPTGLIAPPYAGYARDQELFGDSALQLQDFYEHYQLRIDPSWCDLPDHIAAIAEACLHLLTSKQGDAALELCLNYLAPWFACYQPAIQAHDRSGFFAMITSLINNSLNQFKEVQG